MLVRTQRYGRGLVRPPSARPIAEEGRLCDDEQQPIAPSSFDNISNSIFNIASHANQLEAEVHPPISSPNNTERSTTSSSQLVVVKGPAEPPLPAPRWHPGLRTSDLPYSRPDWQDGAAKVRWAMYNSHAVRMLAVIDRPQRLAEALLQHARTTHGSPRVTAAWRSRADVHRFLCYSLEKQALEGPYKLRCPDTAPLLLPSSAVRRPASQWHPPAMSVPHGSVAGGGTTGAAATGGVGAVGGADSAGIWPNLAEALNCAESWQQQRVLIQHDILCVVITQPADGTYDYDYDGTYDTADEGFVHVDFHPCDPAVGTNSGGGGLREDGGESWYDKCKVVLDPVLSWIRNKLLGRYWRGPPNPLMTHGTVDAQGDSLVAATACSSPGDIRKGVPVAATLPPPLPYVSGLLSLELGADGALLPLRYCPSDDRVIVQLRGSRRVLLVPPSQALPTLAPFPVLHPYDGYSMPAVSHSLVSETPGVDVSRAVAAGLVSWPGFPKKVSGFTALLSPGDALMVPAGWFLHSELLPAPTRPRTNTDSTTAGHLSVGYYNHHHQPPNHQHSPHPATSPPQHPCNWPKPLPNHNLALILTLQPRVVATTPQTPPPTAAQSSTPQGSLTSLVNNKDNKVNKDNVTSASIGLTETTETSTESKSQPVQLHHQRQPHHHRAPWMRPLAPGAGLLQLSRLLEAWTLACEVRPGPELRRTLTTMAEYHELRRRVQRELERVISERGREEKARQLALTAERSTERSTSTEASTSRSARAAASPPKVEGGSASAQRDLADLSALPPVLRLQLHPVFNSVTPEGRVMMDLYNMVVRQVGPVARAALAAAAVAAPSGVQRAASGGGSGAGRDKNTKAATAAAECGGGGGGACGSVSECTTAPPPVEVNRKDGADEGGHDGVDDADADDADDGLAALLRRVCEGRLGSTAWVNQLCRDPEVLRERVMWYDDKRTAEEARFPELFRLQVTAKEAAARHTTIRPAALTHQPLMALPQPPPTTLAALPQPPPTTLATLPQPPPTTLATLPQPPSTTLHERLLTHGSTGPSQKKLLTDLLDEKP